ncbi:MAG: DegV family protein [Clostridia bacterium]
MIKIVTDSAGDISKEKVQAHDIEILPVLITHKDKTFREFYDITTLEYYDLLLSSEEIPKTSQVSIEAFMQCFKKAKENGIKQLLYISINGNGSGTFQTANITRDMFYEECGRDMQIEILDSETYSYIYGEVVVNCAIKVKEGKTFEEIIEFAKKEIASCEAYLGVFDLKYLKKSGRISGGAAFVGEALGLRPISYVGKGEVTVCEKVRGDLNVYKKLASKAKENCTNPEQKIGYIAHGICDEEHLDFLENELLNTVGFKKVERVLLGAAITTNAGPKSVAVFYHK